MLADPVRAAEGIVALFRGGDPEDALDGGALLGAALIQLCTGKYPATPPGDDED